MKTFLPLLVLSFVTAEALGQQAPTGRVASHIAGSIEHRETFRPVGLFQRLEESASERSIIGPVVREASLFELDGPAVKDVLLRGDERIALSLPTGTGPMELLLERADIFSDGFSVVSASTGPWPTAGTGLHYRGIIAGDPSSLASISVYPDEVMGVISDAGGNHNLGRIEGTRGAHILYAEDHLVEPPELACATPDDAGGEPMHGDDTGSGDRSLKCVDLYWEVNYNVFTGQGGMTNTVNYITGLFNQHATLYANDGITVSLSELFVWDVTSPYNSTSSSGLLTQFKNYRNSFNGDLAHLLGYGGGGGIAAGFAGLCASNLDNSMCYSGIQATYSQVPTYSWSVTVVTHEEGHLLGSRHTHACVWNGNGTAIDGCGPAAGYGYEGSCSGAPIPSGGGTIMSYCHLNAVGTNFSLGFGPQPAALIVSNVENAACLGACGTGVCAVPMGLAVGQLTTTSAVLTWGAAPGAVTYGLQWRLVGTQVWSVVNGITGTVHPLTGLLAGTSYEFSVRSDCNAGGSAYSILQAFSTLSQHLTCVVLQPGPEQGVDARLLSNAALAHNVTNYGTEERFCATAWTYSGGNFSISRSLLRFDLTAIPPNSVLEAARFSAYHHPAPNHAMQAGSNEAYLRNVTSPWNESAVTWNSQPATTTASQVLLPATVVAAADIVDVNVLSLVQPWVNTPTGNFGMMMGLTAETTYRNLMFASSDAPYPASRPALNVCLAAPSLRAKVFLEGAVVSGSTPPMRDDLRVAGLLPSNEPYTALGFPQLNGSAIDVLGTGATSVMGSDAIVDWVRLELRQANSPQVIAATRSALLQRDGDIVAADGVSPVIFSAPIGQYHLAVRHRNHLGVMTTGTYNFNGEPVLIDLTSAATVVWGVDARKSVNGAMALWMGNVVRNGNLKYTGTGNDRDPILTRVGSTTPNNSASGYFVDDTNLNGQVKYTGSGNDRDPILVNVGSTTPNNIRTEQLP